ncbi:DUF4062 domain-containing protein [Parvibaculum sp.]|uniref:DUF4062 domain-containing protein n=1 Tax=Parvibaculum sp. TaxID=2024848 RepID=UPI003BA8D019
MRGSIPTVMVSSTFYDLREIRQQLAGFIERELGYRALISESSTFPIDPDADAIENCRRRVEQNADILILVIGSRYGYVEPESGRSVTNLEYLGARAKGIPVYSFIDKRTQALFDAWSAAAEPARDALSGTVDCRELFEFIREVRATDAVWMFGFETASDIIGTLRVQLAYQMDAGLELQRAVRRHPDRDLLAALSGRAFRIALEKPKAWEYRLFSQALADEVANLGEMRREYDLGIAFGPVEHVSVEAFPRWAQLKIEEIGRLIRISTRLVNETLQEAFGPSGQPGSAPQIVFVAKRLGRVYREAMEWSFGVRRAHSEEDEFRGLVDALGNCSRDLVEKLGNWTATLVPGIEDALCEANSGAAGGARTVSFTMAFEAAEIDELLSAMRAVYARRGIVVP